MTDGNEGLLIQNHKRIRFSLEETAVTPEEAHLLMKFGNSELRAQAKSLLSRNGHNTT